MTARNKLWSIDDVDPDGNLGMTIVLASSKDAARRKFRKIHGGYLKAIEIEECAGWMSLAMWDSKKGATGYLRRAYLRRAKVQE